jgi:homoserine dehydrogenase
MPLFIGYGNLGKRVLDVLYDGQQRLASMTDAEVEALARELSLEREKRFPGL